MKMLVRCCGDEEENETWNSTPMHGGSPIGTESVNMLRLDAFGMRTSDVEGLVGRSVAVSVRGK